MALQPSLFIGLGESGLRCLELIEQRMPVPLPREVRMLGIRMERARAEEQEDGLGTGLVIDLPWDSEQAQRLAHETPGYVWWLGEDIGQHDARVNARLAFHIHRHFDRDERLDAFRNNMIQSLGISASNKLNVYLVAGMLDAEAAFLADALVELARGFPTDSLGLCMPWLVAPAPGGEPAERQGWVSAGLRELERFMLRDQVLLGMPGEEPVEGELFSHVLFMDDDSLLPALADQLAALAEKSAAVAFSNDLGNMTKPARFSMMASRSFTFSLPANEIRQACAGRLLKEEVLLDAPSLTKGQVQGLVTDFLRGGPGSPPGWELFRSIVQAPARRGDEIVRAPGNPQGGAPASALRTALGTCLSSFEGTLVDQQVFLQQLLEILRGAADGRGRTNVGGESMRRQMPQFRSVVDDFTREIARWQDELARLCKAVEARHARVKERLLDREHGAAHESVLYRRRGTAAQGDDPAGEYYAELRVRPEGWQELVRKARELLDWEWSATEGHKAYLRCLMEGKLYSRAEGMDGPLWAGACALMRDVAKRERVIDYLGALGARDMAAQFSKAPRLLRYDPLRASERATRYYLVGAQHPAIQGWGLDAQVGLCETEDAQRLTSMRFDFNLPVDGALFAREAAGGSVENGKSGGAAPAFAFPHEQHAWAIEQEMLKLRLTGAGRLLEDPAAAEEMRRMPFPARMVRLMHAPADFDTMMRCVFWNWVADAERGKPWLVDTGDGAEPTALGPEGFAANSLEEALRNALVVLPNKDMGGWNALAVGNYPKTMGMLRAQLRAHAKLPRKKRAEGYAEIARRIRAWWCSADPFDRGLAKYQTYLLAGELRAVQGR